MKTEDIYFIAVILPAEICKSITAFRLDFADRFKSKAALRIIPHITLKAPFKLPLSQEPGLKNWFQSIDIQKGRFQIELKDFGVFNKKRHPVVFVKPVASPALISMQQEIISSFRDAYPEIDVTEHERRFSPHITIAYRDLNFENFSEAWKEYGFREYRAVFEMDHFSLLHHDGSRWNVIDTHAIN